MGSVILKFGGVSVPVNSKIRDVIASSGLSVQDAKDRVLARVSEDWPTRPWLKTDPGEMHKLWRQKFQRELLREAYMEMEMAKKGKPKPKPRPKPKPGSGY